MQPMGEGTGEGAEARKPALSYFPLLTFNFTVQVIQSHGHRNAWAADFPEPFLQKQVVGRALAQGENRRRR